MSRPLVTVNTLLVQSRERGAIELPANALITPAAADWLRDCRVPVRRVGPDEPARTDVPALYFIGDAAQPDVQTLLPTLERQHAGFRFLPCHGRRNGLLEAVRVMCEGLRDSARRGIILVSNAAIPNCVANKYAHVRAAVLLQPSGLYVLQRELGLNVLIFERGRLSLRQMQATIEAFLSGKAGLDPVIEAALSDLPADRELENAPACECRN